MSECVCFQTVIANIHRFTNFMLRACTYANEAEVQNRKNKKKL